MIRIILILLLLCGPAVAQKVTPDPGVPASGGTYPNGFTVTGSMYYAKDPQYGNCTWSTAGGADAGPCINAAITAAAAAGGGTVTLPAGNFNLATQILNGTSGVSLAGAGVGYFRDSNTPSAFVSVTKLIWTGSAGATMFLNTPSGTRSLYSTNVTGIVFDCASLANICADFVATNTSTINVGVSEPVTIGFRLTTKSAAFADGPGSQLNDIWVQSRSTSAVNAPTGILIDGATGSSFDTSINHFHFLSAWLAKGDGVVFGYSDNNSIDQIVTYQDPTNKGGTPLVWANSMYVQKNGLTVGGAAIHHRLFKSETSGIVDGLFAGSTIVAGVHGGTAAVTTVPLTTNGPTTQLASILNFASTTGAAIGMTLSCSPSWACGIPPGTPIIGISGSTLTMGAQAPNQVATSTVVTLSYGITANAVPGTYTMTAADATHWTIAAPAGGHNQSNIALTGNNIIFTDMVIPLTGTPSANDTFIITVPTPSSQIVMESIDKSNSVSDPMAEPGAVAFFSRTTNPIDAPTSGPGDIIIVPTLGTSNAVQIGGTPTGTSTLNNGSVQIGGNGNQNAGFGTTTIGGHSLTNTGTYGFATGDTNTLAGQTSFVEGSASNDRGRNGTHCQGGNFFAVSGDAQTCTTTLRNIGATGSAFRLTWNAVAAGNNNCINIPNNAAYALNITILAFDHTTVTKNALWPNWTGLLTRGANAASTAVSMNATPTPLTNGTLTGQAISVTADTTQGCLNISYTPPTSNTDTFNAVATVTTTEVQ